VAATVVVDSGIILATILEETYSKQAAVLVDTWVQENQQLAAPALFRYESIAVLRKSVSRQRLTIEQALDGWKRVQAYPIDFYLDDRLLQRAFELASRLNRPTAYDSQYLAVAEYLGCEFWTADERFYNSVHTSLNWVKWLGHVTLP
jgi:predicted nucleic acid-binding protein